MSEYHDDAPATDISTEETGPYSRRSLLKSALALSGVTLFSTFMAAGVAQADSKSSKSAVRYQDQPNGNKRCSGCEYFIPGESTSAKGKCKIVQGAISPHGYCIAFSPKS